MERPVEAKSKRKLPAKQIEGNEKAVRTGNSAAATTGVERLTKSDKLKRSKQVNSISGCLFEGVHAFFIARGINRKRLQVWQTRFTELGGTILASATASYKLCDLVHILAADEVVLAKELDLVKLKGYKKLRFVQYGWIENCLKDGRLLSSEPFNVLQGHKQGSTKENEGRRSNPRPQSELGAKAAETDTTDTVEDFAVSGEAVRSDGAPVRNLTSELVQDASSITDENAVHGPWEDEAPDYNKHVAGPLREMSSIYTDFFADEWRALTYRKAANKLDKLPYKISSAEELKSIQGIGKSMTEKIAEILSSRRLQKLENLRADAQVQTIQQFASVWGIGPKIAKRLYQAGHRTLQDIYRDSSLPSMARVGLKYHHDIVLRIPRAEVAEAGSFVQTVLKDLCPGAWLTVGGSYRRGQSTCGDIDLLITHPDGSSHSGLMSRLIGKLQDIEFLSASSTGSSRPWKQNESNKIDSFMGICKLPHHCHHRRIDIKIYPKDVYAFALVYFTGNDVLNRRIRYFARTKGYKLSDQGLFLRPGKGKNDSASEVSIPCYTEKDIFDKLELPYPEPQDRNW